MHAVSQIIDRNLLRARPLQSCLWINPEADANWQGLKTNCKTLKLFSQDHGAYSSLLEAGADIEFSAFPSTANKKHQWIIVNLPRQKALLTMMLDCAASLLSADGALWLAGENKAGIKSADKLLKLHFAQVTKLDNARHCTLFEASDSLSQQTFKPSAYRQTWQLECNDAGIDVISYPGVFAHGRLDPGTALLLQALANMDLQGDVLDFACGAGVIGACIGANHTHTRMTMLDSNALALKASKETLAVNHLQGNVLASDGLSKLKESYDIIVSNPPIHRGIKTDNLLSMRLLDTVHEYLKPGGLLILVTNIHLPYENWLSRKFKRFRQLLVNDSYKVFVAKK